MAIVSDRPSPEQVISSADHAATVRGALWHGQGLGGHNNYRAAEEALASLLALADRATELEEEQANHAADLEAAHAATAKQERHVETLLARATELERERDAALDREAGTSDAFAEMHGRVVDTLAMYDRERERAERAEAALRGARELIASRHFVKGKYVCRYCWASDGHEETCPTRAALGETAPQISDEGMIQPHYRPGDWD